MIQPALMVARISALPVRSLSIIQIRDKKDPSMTSMPSIRFTRRTLALAAAALLGLSTAAMAQ